jgi:hypothetical protein
MEDYTAMGLIQLIDLLSSYTSQYTKLYFEESTDEELDEIKNKIIALQEEIKKRRGMTKD